MSDKADLRDGRTVAEKTLLDHSVLHTEQHAHEQTKASLLRLQREKKGNQ